jgi:hypothetical protein
LLPIKPAGWNRAASEKKGTPVATNPPTGGGSQTNNPPAGGGTPPKNPTGGGTTTPPTGGTPSGSPKVPDDQNYIILTMANINNETIYLSDDGKNFLPKVMEPDKPFAFQFEIYKYGWLRMKHFNGYRVYKLEHGKDYSILFNYRTQNWTVVEVPQ